MSLILHCGTEFQTAKDGATFKLTHEDEKNLIENDQDIGSKGIGFSKSNFFRFAGDLANKRVTPFKTAVRKRFLNKRHNDLPSLRLSSDTKMMTKEST